MGVVRKKGRWEDSYKKVSLIASLCCLACFVLASSPEAAVQIDLRLFADRLKGQWHEQASTYNFQERPATTRRLSTQQRSNHHIWATRRSVRATNPGKPLRWTVVGKEEQRTWHCRFR